MQIPLIVSESPFLCAGKDLFRPSDGNPAQAFRISWPCGVAGGAELLAKLGIKAIVGHEQRALRLRPT